MRVLLALTALFLLGANETLTPDDNRIGTWDGKTQQAALAGPYEDPAQAEIPFGRRSYYLTPWRAYMDTWPASRLLECPGINFNVSDKEAEATAQLLSECGIRSARVEIGWGNFRYDDPTKMPDATAQYYTAILQALKRHRIRPLILLNANSGAPCPHKALHVRLRRDAPAGSRTVVLDSPDEVQPGYTGLTHMAYPMAYPLITHVDKSNGTCTLSAPLPKALKQGDLELETLKYQPFGGAKFADGSDNRAAQETLEGWKTYVASLCTFLRDVCGEVSSGDAGFDLEVWNEYTFGSQYLDEKNYYDPPRSFKEDLSYSGYNQTRHGSEIILPITIDYVNDSSHGLNGVGVISGFSNQRPWDDGSDMWPRQMGFSRHYYTNLELKPLSPATEPAPNNGPLNALGRPDGVPDGKDWNTVKPGSFFIPTLNNSMPEWWQYGYKTEFMTRDLQPFPGPMKGHYRYGEPHPGHAAQVWMSEFNTWREPWMEAVIKAAGCAKDDPRAIALSHAIGSRAILRALVFHSHKGVHTIDLFAAKDDDLGFAFLPSAFFKALAADNYVLTDKVRAQAGPQWAVLKRLTTLFKPNIKMERAVGITRALSVGGLVEHKPRLVFKGDGTPAHPDRYNRDDFACLPFQIGEQHYAVGYYVVTHNMVHEWDRTKDRLDPARYTMPDQEFDLTLNNINGQDANVNVYDPLTDKMRTAGIIASTKTSLTVRLPTTDTPRFLLIREAKPGPLIIGPHFQIMPGNTCRLIFNTNLPMPLTISWGKLPERRSERVIPVRLNATASVSIPLPRGEEGVQIVGDHDGLKVRWPQWGYDVVGRLPLASPLKNAPQPGTQPPNVPSPRIKLQSGAQP